MNNKQFENEITQTNPSIIASKTIKYLGINSTKWVKDLYYENYKTLLKEIKEDVNKWKHIPCTWTRIFSII